MKSIYEKLLFLLLMFPLSMLAQSTLQGTVIDSRTKQSIPGVNVNVQGSTNGTSTDFDGKFKISKLKSGDKIIFSFIGYKNETIDFTGQSSVSVQLNEDSNRLQEVVVQVGYGNVKKKDATGSVSILSAKDFNKGSNVTVDNLLNGRIAGVTINSGGGSPGSGSKIRIRGGSSLDASNDPLIVIDGLPLSNEGNASSTSILAAINPNDIESFSILKDASATAIYGSRASNGVIIITTKKGGKKLSIDYNFQYGSGSVTKLNNVYNANDFRRIIFDKYPVVQQTGSTPLTAAQIASNAINQPFRNNLGSANTNWQEEIYRRTDYVDNSISIKGTFLNSFPARLSIGNTYQEGSRLTNFFNRTSISTSLNPSFLNDHLKFKINATFTRENNRFADGVEGSAIRFDPTQPVYKEGSPWGGFFEYYGSNGQLTPVTNRNPVAQLLQTNDQGKNNRIYGNFEIDYKFHFFPALRAVINAGFDQSNGTRTKQQAADAATSPDYLGIKIGKNETEEILLRNKLLDAFLVYNKKLGKFTTEFTAGYSYQIFNTERFETGNINRGSGQPFLDNSKYKPEVDNVIIGYFGRANLTFNDKYLLTLTFRRDGSSRFGDGPGRWLNSPGIAFAWKVKNDFFKESNTLSDLKLRMGYGVTGQQNLDNKYNNIYLQQYAIGQGSSSQYTIGSAAYQLALSKGYNPLLKWEQTTTYNAGFDYGLFKNRLSGSVDVYYKRSFDQLFEAPLADGANFTNKIIQNIGSFTTKGIEFSINAEIVKSTSFNWNINFNFTKYERRVEDLGGNPSFLSGDVGFGTSSGNSLITTVGYTPQSFYVFKQIYYPGTSLPIEGAFTDLNGDGIINDNDRYIYKNPDPDAVFGFSSNINYLNFDFSFNLRASVGNRVYNAVAATKSQGEIITDTAGSAFNNLGTSFSTTNFNSRDKINYSDYFVENASFLRCDNITLGYTFQKFVEGKAKLRLSLGVQNAFVITKYSGLDPEINDGIDKTIYPRQRQVLFGANLKF